MSIRPHDRRAFLEALVIYARESQTFNPHFHLSEMLSRLGIDEGTFNILRSELGPCCCHFVDIRNGEKRYAINLKECLALKDQFDSEKIEARRHSQLVRLMV